MAQVKIRHIHFSSLSGRTPLTLLRAIRIFITLSNLITFTEVADNRRLRKLMGHLGWRVAHVESTTTRGEDEVAVMYRTRTFDQVTFRARRLSTIPVPRRNNARIFSLDLDMRIRRTHQLLFLTLAHFPSGVQRGTRWNPENPQQVAAYKDAATHWHANITQAVESRRYAGIMVVADWNLDLRLQIWRDYIRNHTHRSLTTPWLGHMPTPRLGTHSRRVIDGTFTNLRLYQGRIRVLRRAVFQRASDHRPYREVLLMPLAPETAPATTRALTTFALPKTTTTTTTAKITSPVHWTDPAAFVLAA